MVSSVQSLVTKTFIRFKTIYMSLWVLSEAHWLAFDLGGMDMAWISESKTRNAMKLLQNVRIYCIYSQGLVGNQMHVVLIVSTTWALWNYLRNLMWVVYRRELCAFIWVVSRFFHRIQTSGTKIRIVTAANFGIIDLVSEGNKIEATECISAER